MMLIIWPTLCVFPMATNFQAFFLVGCLSSIWDILAPSYWTSQNALFRDQNRLPRVGVVTNLELIQVIELTHVFQYILLIKLDVKRNVQIACSRETLVAMLTVYTPVWNLGSCHNLPRKVFLQAQRHRVSGLSGPPLDGINSWFTVGVPASWRCASRKDAANFGNTKA